MMLPLPTPDAAHSEPLSPVLVEFVDRFIADSKASLKLFLTFTCDRDGHRPVARWRGDRLRCWKCQRCGEETLP
jgi:hypothetical protein